MDHLWVCLWGGVGALEEISIESLNGVKITLPSVGGITQSSEGECL